jgi:Uri superfamily endonuclease
MRGTYILVLFTKKDFHKHIGALGEVNFQKGYYCYVGSAMGKRGSATLENRLKRHAKAPSDKSIHWHIDYLLSDKRTLLFKIYIISNEQRLECLIAREIEKNANDYVKDFGSSDCACPSHLFFFQEWNI